MHWKQYIGNALTDFTGYQERPDILSYMCLSLLPLETKLIEKSVKDFKKF